MDTASSWKQCFHNWPSTLKRQGVLVAKFDQIPFVDFLISNSMVVVQRRAPDAMGARMVMVPFENIEGLKLTEIIDAHALEPLGIYKSASKLATLPQETIKPISQKVERTLDALSTT